MTTCHPAFAYTSVKLSQPNTAHNKIHYHGLKHTLKFLYNSHAMTASISGELLPILTSPKVPLLPSTVINMTFS
jgi:hypothetical protein